MNFTHPPQTDEQKDASVQLNNIGTINALNTHNWELQQKVMVLNAENERLHKVLDDVIIRLCAKNERMYSLLVEAQDYIDDIYDELYIAIGKELEVQDYLRFAKKALGETDEL